MKYRYILTSVRLHFKSNFVGYFISKYVCVKFYNDNIIIFFINTAPSELNTFSNGCLFFCVDTI